MKLRTLLLFLALFAGLSMYAQEDNIRYIEVTGTSEIEIVPDEIHYIIEIKEYFAEEFYPNSKPEDYHTKVHLDKIEQKLRTALSKVGIPSNAIRMQEAGDYWRRKQGQDFLFSKTFDITLNDFSQIDEIAKHLDTKGINTMRIGELKNRNMQDYHQQGRIKALQAAQKKAASLVGALGKQLGDVLRIVEGGNSSLMGLHSNVILSDNDPSDNFRTITHHYSMQVRFDIKD